MPPCSIIVGGADYLLDDNLTYANALLQAGVEVNLCLYEGMPHGFMQMTNECGLDAVRVAAMEIGRLQ